MALGQTHAGYEPNATALVLVFTRWASSVGHNGLISMLCLNVWVDKVRTKELLREETSQSRGCTGMILGVVLEVAR